MIPISRRGENRDDAPGMGGVHHEETVEAQRRSEACTGSVNTEVGARRNKAALQPALDGGRGDGMEFHISNDKAFVSSSLGLLHTAPGGSGCDVDRLFEEDGAHASGWNKHVGVLLLERGGIAARDDVDKRLDGGKP